MKTVVIVGPGAMGCLFAWFLHEQVENLWLLDHRAERVKIINEQGLKLETKEGVKNIRVKITEEPTRPGSADLVILCVKAYATREALSRAMPVVGPQTTVLSLQNGLGNVETMISMVGEERVLGGTTAQGANVVGPGHIRHAGQGETVIGEPGGKSGRAARVVELFRSAGIEARGTDDLEGLIWSKVIINVGINALTALLRVRNGKLLEYEGARHVMRQAVEEALAVCKKKGIRLLHQDPLAKVEAVAQATAQNISSMLQDVRNSRRTEVEQINGAIVREARRLGLPAPVNETLTSLIAALEQSYAHRLD